MPSGALQNNRSIGDGRKVGLGEHFDRVGAQGRRPEAACGCGLHMRRYESSDLAEMNEWYARRGMAPMDPAHLPTIGYIEPGVAAGFMYVTDSKLVFLENYVANP